MTVFDTEAPMEARTRLDTTEDKDEDEAIQLLQVKGVNVERLFESICSVPMVNGYNFVGQENAAVSW